MHITGNMPLDIKVVQGRNYFIVWYTYSDFSMDSSCHGEGSSLAHYSMDMSILGNPLREPEPLGSVTHNQEVNGSSTSLQIRSSARVSKKMRLDCTAPPVASVVPDKKGVFFSPLHNSMKLLTVLRLCEVVGNWRVMLGYVSLV